MPKETRGRPDTNVLKRVVDLLIYGSVALGGVLLLAAAPLVPTWLLGALALGEAAYGVCAVCVARGIRRAYYAVLALAVLVLLVSLPQPDHYAFATSGDLGAFLIFAAGSALQVCILVSVPVYLRRTRTR
ncbi:MAG: hypothetical protein OK456_04110 [Thaumarchaeota archaeon]|nr:hypothetical protein [Nitrososphaerota archaeon]